ncbi:PA14 domain-containing protein [Cerasicoccus frondis]|uniref:PA14 domain-containing protein n=1 Tax=Cerasicoccus frondis TaxID=490090 RepID=UPI0028527973|nr:PA14 domain-containing protein [Cerasicoccus frondis]
MYLKRFLLTALLLQTTQVCLHAELSDTALSLKLDGTASEFILASTSDEEGNLYVAGATSSPDLKATLFQSSDVAAGASTISSPVDQVAQSTITSSVYGETDIFVIKYDYEGQVEWVATAGGAGEDAATGIVVDTDGNVYVSGYMEGDVIFGGTSVNANENSSGVSTDARNLFLATLDSSGNWDQVNPIPLNATVKSGGSNVSGKTLTGVNLTTGRMGSNLREGNTVGDSLANVAQSLNDAGGITVYIKGEVDTSGLGGAVPNSGTYDYYLGLDDSSDYFLCSVDSDDSQTDNSGTWAFIIKATYSTISASDNAEWTWDWLTPVSTVRNADEFSTITQIETSPDPDDDKIYLTGYWSGDLAAGSTFNSGDEEDGFVMAIKASGSTSWVATVTGYAVVNALAIEPDLYEGSSVLIAGNIYDGETAEFNYDTSYASISVSASSDTSNGFLALLNPNGKFIWAETTDATGTDAAATATHLVRRYQGDYFLAGSYTGYVTLSSNNTDLSGGQSAPTVQAAYLANLDISTTGSTCNWVEDTRSSEDSEVYSAMLTLNRLQSVYWSVANGTEMSLNTGGAGLNGDYYLNAVSGYEEIASFEVKGEIKGAVSLSGSVYNYTGGSNGSSLYYTTTTFETSADTYNQLWGWCEDKTIEILGYDIEMGQLYGFANYYWKEPTIYCASLWPDEGAYGLGEVPLVFDRSVPYIGRQSGDLTVDWTSIPIDRGVLADGSTVTMQFYSRNSHVTVEKMASVPGTPLHSVFTASPIWYADDFQARINGEVYDFDEDRYDSHVIISTNRQFDFTLPEWPLYETPFTGTIEMERVDGPIYFDWEDNSPVSRDIGYSVIWTGWIVVPTTGDYTVRMSFSRFSEVVIGDEIFWTCDGDSSTKKRRELEAGVAYPITIRYQPDDDVTSATSPDLRWQLSGSYEHTVDAEYLFPYEPDLTVLNASDFPLTSRGLSSQDEVYQAGVVTFAIKADGGEGQPEFLDWREYVVGDELEPVAGAVISSSSTATYYPDLSDYGSNVPIYTDPTTFSAYAAGEIRVRMLCAEPTSNSSISLYHQGYAIAIRWPTEEEGLIDYLYGDLIPAIDLDREDTVKIFQTLQYTDNGTVVEDSLLETTAAGYSTLLFLDDGADLTTTVPDFVVVRAVDWADYVTTADAVIGETIPIPDDAVDESVDGASRTGYVMRDLARVDADSSVYDRDTYLGQIIPVNLEEFVDGDEQADDDDLDVAWFTQYTQTSTILWPYEVIHYTASWPSDYGRIVIASGEGSEGMDASGAYQDSFTDNESSLSIYNQPDKTLMGYNPNEEHAVLVTGQRTGAATAYALRNDLNNQPSDTTTSDAYVLVRYFDETEQLWAYRIYEVLQTDSNYPSFNVSDGTAGSVVYAPYPLSLSIFYSTQTIGSGDPYWLDRTGQVWAVSAGTMIAQYFYTLYDGFWYDADGDGVLDDATDVAWLSGGYDDTTPINIYYEIEWPADIATMNVGDTVAYARDGVPGIYNMLSAEIIYDSRDVDAYGNTQANVATATKATLPSARIYDMVSPRRYMTPGLYGKGLGTSLQLLDDENNAVVVELDAVETTDKLYEFEDLSLDLISRFYYDPTENDFVFKGLAPDDSYVGDPVMLPNVMTAAEAEEIMLLDDADGVESAESTEWDLIIENLYLLTRNPSQARDIASGPNVISDETEYAYDLVSSQILIGLAESDDPDVIGYQHIASIGGGALTTAFSSGEGYIAIAENNDESLTDPVNVHLVHVVDSGVVGQLVNFESENLLEENYYVRHRSDFGGRADELYFEWYWQEYASENNAEGKSHPAIVVGDDAGPGGTWLKIAEGYGLNRFVIESGVEILSDGWLLVRYKGLNTDAISVDDWFGYAGDAQGTTSDPFPHFVKGWVKRVLENINPFEQRFSDFHSSETETYVTMIEQAGSPYVGDIALNGSDTDYLNSIGLIELYTTVLNRALKLSLEANPALSTTGVRDQLLFAATRTADLYMLLANEAYADAQDPTIGFTTSSDAGYLAPTYFAFEGQASVPDLLAEELILLRGRDLSGFPAYPIYNRLPWNYNTDGEAIYNTAYAITDADPDGLINEYDAKVMYPMGHGDAWGHYLSALSQYYSLLRHPEYDWQAHTEGTTIAGTSVEVDYLSEKKFAAAALGLARTGLEVMKLEYCDRYTGNPSGQWQGYKDTDAERAWGVDEWGRRTAQGALVNWVVGNAILPEEDTEDTDLSAQVDRTTVDELSTLSSVVSELERTIARYDRGLNPLGIDSQATPFDIDPDLFNDATNPRSHFEQIYDRALDAVSNALQIFDFANDQTQRIRQGTLDAADFALQVEQQEMDYRSRLIEIFGYPYTGDIGVGKTYPLNYDGPDLYHYMYMDANTVSEEDLPESEMDSVVASFNAFKDAATFGSSKYNFLFDTDVDKYTAAAYLDVNADATLDVTYPYASTADYTAIAPESWGSRRACGDLQLILMETLRLQSLVLEAQANQAAIIEKAEDQVEVLESLYNVRAEQIEIYDETSKEYRSLAKQIAVSRGAATGFSRTGDAIYRSLKVAMEFLPKSVNLDGGDILSAARGSSMQSVSAGIEAMLYAGAATLEIDALLNQADLDILSFEAKYEIDQVGYKYEIQKQLAVIEALLYDEMVARYEVYQNVLAVTTKLAEFEAKLAEGQRLLEERALIRRQAAGTTQEARYQDMTFRIFRNDALQKYRAAFDLAARYTYLAARAFDYETTLLADDSDAGWQFYDNIIRQRTLGEFGDDGNPVAGSEGLSAPLADMDTIFANVRTSYGINSPQIEENRFSLRTEAFRIKSDFASDDAWRDTLMATYVSNVWDVPEYRRYCSPSRSESSGPLPALVITFSSAIASGQNFFGWPLGGGDSSYDSSRFSTRVSSVGVWFENYDGNELALTPRVYLVPVGIDIIRSPSDEGAIRQFNVYDQAIPMPETSISSYSSDDGWIPSIDTVTEGWGTMRRYSRFRAYHDDGFDESEMTSDTRLIARSVWNTEWMLVITGDTLLADPDEGITRFIFGDPIDPDDTGVTDIKLFFETYSYSGD